MADDQELDYLAKHPGGFDREFWEEHFLGMLEQAPEDLRGLPLAGSGGSGQAFGGTPPPR